MKTYEIDGDTGRQLSGPIDRTRHSPAVDEAAYKLIAQLRGTAPVQEVKLPLPKKPMNIYHAHTSTGRLVIYALDPYVSPENLDSLLRGEKPDLREGIDLTAEEITNPERAMQIAIAEFCREELKRR